MVARVYGSESYRGERRPVEVETLYPGYYILVCTHCGFPCRVSFLNRKNDKCWVTCHRCGKRAKHYKLTMEEVINFKENANSKLNCEYFTLLRLYDPAKHCVGNRFEIRLNNIPKGYAHIVAVNRITLDQIREYIARLDAGCSAEECRRQIREAYGKRPVDWGTQPIAYCLMRYAGNENKLFNDFDK